MRLVSSSGVWTVSTDSADDQDSLSRLNPAATVAGRSQRSMTGRTRALLRTAEPGGSNF